MTPTTISAGTTTTSSTTAAPTAELSHLPKADGSACFSHGGFTITASVNGPVEAQRRDENAFEAVVDVNVRPAAGVGGTAERQLEAILQSALSQLILVKNFPRCVIQVTLQTMETPENAYVNAKITQARLSLAIIPGLLHAAVLGLLTAAIPLKTIVSAVTLAILQDEANGTVFKADPSPAEIGRAKSVHVLGFTSDDELLLGESEGAFTVNEWDRVLQAGQRICCQTSEQDPSTASTGETYSVKGFIRSVMETKAAQDIYWK